MIETTDIIKTSEGGEINLSAEEFQIIYVHIAPSRRWSINPHSKHVLCTATSTQRGDIEKGLGRRSNLRENLGKHCLSQLTKGDTNSGKSHR